MPEPFSRRNKVLTGIGEPAIVDDASARVRRGIFRVSKDAVDAFPLLELVQRRVNEDVEVGPWDRDAYAAAFVLLERCPWYKVYDLVEDVHAYLASPSSPWQQTQFDQRINELLAMEGVALSLVDGIFVVTKAEALVRVAGGALQATEAAGLENSRAEIQSAVHDLSIRPTPALVGAARHVMAAFEATLRAAGGDPKGTPKQILMANPTLLPEPMKTVFGQVWGYASDKARHLTEGETIPEAEAAFVIHLGIAAIEYLATHVADAEAARGSPRPRPTSAGDPRHDSSVAG